MVCDIGAAVKVLKSLPFIHTRDAQDSRIHNAQDSRIHNAQESCIHE